MDARCSADTYAWLGSKKQRAKIQVVGKYDVLMLPCPGHDLTITGLDISHTAPVNCIVACLIQERHPDFRNIHVQKNRHDASRGKSYSSALHVA